MSRRLQRAALSLACAALPCAAARAQDATPPAPAPAASPSAPAPTAGRFDLVEAEPDEVLVLDRRSGVLFAVNLRLRTTLMIDPTRGTAVSRPLAVHDAEATVETPRWPTRADLDARGEALRYRPISGQTAGVFDSASGRLFQVVSPRVLHVVDPVAGSLTRRAVALVREVRELTEAQEAAVQWLRAINALQRAHRATTDRYGDGAELARAGLLQMTPPPGYRVGVWVAPGAPGERWIAAAQPEAAAGTGFVINHEGVVHRVEPSFEVDEAGCELPPEAIALE